MQMFCKANVFLAILSPWKCMSKKAKGKNAYGWQRIYTYDHDIICLPKSELGKDGLVRIPRKEGVRDFLAMNKLIGKIRLTSDMSEGAIFKGPVAGDPNFRFKILQTCGGGKYSSLVIF